MIKENLKNLKKVRTISSTDMSEISLLSDGRILKIIDPYVIEINKDRGIDLEAKVAYADNLHGLVGIHKPSSIVYDNGVFVGNTATKAKGIDYNLFDDYMSLDERCDLEAYADRFCQIEKIVKEAEKYDIVIPDLCSMDNIFIDENGNMSLIDYDGMQVGPYGTAVVSTSLMETVNIFGVKYFNYDCSFTKEINKTSLAILYFLDCFSINLASLGHINPYTFERVTIRNVFEQLRLKDNEFFTKINCILDSRKPGYFISEDVCRIADKYKMVIDDVCEEGYVKRLILK